ncbi:MAG: hypothetical protein HUJ76_01455 [Parasporobacterium sp.]|nr:hypothetical protein [Parasporobacterium sp.]
MRDYLRKSGLILFFYCIVFPAVYAGIGMLAYRQDLMQNAQAAGYRQSMADGAAVSTGDSSFVVTAVAFLIVLLLINIWNVSDYWIESRKKERRIRELCGASGRDILKWLSLSQLIILLLAYAVSMAVRFIMIKMDFFLSPFIESTWLAGTICCGIIGVVCLVLSCIRVYRKPMKHWVVVRYALFFLQMAAVTVMVLTVGGRTLLHTEFMNHFDVVKDELSSVKYLHGMPYMNDRYGELYEYIKEATDGDFYIFTQSSLETDSLDERYAYMSENDRTFFNTVYISEKVQEVFKWDAGSGELFSGEDFDYDMEDDPVNSTGNAVEDGNTLIPLILGSSFEKYHEVGEVLDGKYMIRGFLKPGTFFLNPAWEGRAYTLDNYCIIPVDVIIREWSGAGINGLHLLDPEESVVDGIVKRAGELGIGDLVFRGMEEQLEYIKEDLTYTSRLYLTAALLIVLLSVVGQISMTLFLIEYRRREFMIKIMCGATDNRICTELVCPVVLILLAAGFAGALICNAVDLLWISLIMVLAVTVIIMTAPVLKIRRGNITETLKESE